MFEDYTVFGLLKLPRLLRLGRLFKFFQKFKHATMIKVVRIFMVWGLLAHWIGCVWHLIGLQHPPHGWIYVLEIQDEGLYFHYSISLYHAVMMMMGDGVPAETAFEMNFHTLMVVIGSYFYASIFGQISFLIAQLNARQTRYRAKLDSVYERMRLLELPFNMQHRISKYYEYLWIRDKGVENTTDFISELSPGLQDDVAVFLHRKLVTSVPFFAGCDDDHFVESVLRRLVLCSFLPDEFVVKSGQPGEHMYMMIKGKVAMSTVNHKFMGHMEPGSYFGEIACVFGYRHPLNIKTVLFTDTMTLARDHLNFILQLFPAQKQKTQYVARLRLAAEMDGQTMADDELVDRAKFVGSLTQSWKNWGSSASLWAVKWKKSKHIARKVARRDDDADPLGESWAEWRRQGKTHRRKMLRHRSAHGSISSQALKDVMEGLMEKYAMTPMRLAREPLASDAVLGSDQPGQPSQQPDASNQLSSETR